MHTDRFLSIGKIQGTTEKQQDCELFGEMTVFVLLTASIPGWRVGENSMKKVMLKLNLDGRNPEEH